MHHADKRADIQIGLYFIPIDLKGGNCYKTQTV